MCIRNGRNTHFLPNSFEWVQKQVWETGKKAPEWNFRVGKVGYWEQRRRRKDIYRKDTTKSRSQEFFLTLVPVMLVSVAMIDRLAIFSRRDTFSVRAVWRTRRYTWIVSLLPLSGLTRTAKKKNGFNIRTQRWTAAFIVLPSVAWLIPRLNCKANSVRTRLADGQFSAPVAWVFDHRSNYCFGFCLVLDRWRKGTGEQRTNVR